MSAPARRLELTVPFARPPYTMNDLRRKGHWRDQQRAHDLVRNAVWTLCQQQKPDPFTEPVEVELTWWAPTALRRDADSLGAMVKGALDGLTAAKVLVDDSADYVHRVLLAVVPRQPTAVITLSVTDSTVRR